MTQDEWLNSCGKMEKPMRELIGIVRSMNISGLVEIAVNPDGTTWVETHEAGHKYGFDVNIRGVSVDCDGDCYFTKG